MRKWKLQQLRDGIGTATQDVFLFSDTVEGNIAFGDQTLTEDEVHEGIEYDETAFNMYISALQKGTDRKYMQEIERAKRFVKSYK